MRGTTDVDSPKSYPEKTTAGVVDPRPDAAGEDAVPEHDRRVSLLATQVRHLAPQRDVGAESAAWRRAPSTGASERVKLAVR